MRLVRFAAKAAIRDAGRVLEVPLPLVDKLAKLVPVKPGITLEKALSEAKEMQQFADSTPELRELIRYARALEGQGAERFHACGRSCHY